MMRDQNARRPGARGGFAGGTVLSKDAQSITVKLPDGGSKIVYVSKSTRFEKMLAASVADVSVGSTVTAVGEPQDDGSITARAITLGR